MIATRLSRTTFRGLVGLGAVCVAFSLASTAQVQTSKSEASGEPVKTVKIERGEIVFINGNSAVIKMEDGTLRHFDNIPDSVTFMVDGKPVNIHSAKVGMKVEKQTITTTTPRVVTTVETVTGKVWQVSPPSRVILTLENGENQEFKIPKGQKFTIDGRETDAWGLKKGMKVSAQRVTEVPETVVAQEIKRRGAAPPPPPPPQPDVAILVAVARPAPVTPAQTEPAEPTPKKLPKTASDLPLIGLLGASLGVLSLMCMAIRRIATGLQKRPS
jgi:hypothetical protein